MHKTPARRPRPTRRSSHAAIGDGIAAEELIPRPRRSRRCGMPQRDEIRAPLVEIACPERRRRGRGRLYRRGFGRQPEGARGLDRHRRAQRAPPAPRRSGRPSARKIERLVENGIAPLYCVGETRAEREAGATHAVLAGQIGALDGFAAPPAGFALAYEPVWAIGTGLAATPTMAAEAHGSSGSPGRALGGGGGRSTGSSMAGPSRPRTRRSSSASPAWTEASWGGVAGRGGFGAILRPPEGRGAPFDPESRARPVFPLSSAAPPSSPRAQWRGPEFTACGCTFSSRST